jgi:hypothetical protein
MTPLCSLNYVCFQGELELTMGDIGINQIQLHPTPCSTVDLANDRELWIIINMTIFNSFGHHEGRGDFKEGLVVACALE